MSQKFRGRGIISNNTGRFESRQVVSPSGIENEVEEIQMSPRTEFLKDTSRRIIAQNNSPDIGFRYSLNFYRGCEHGCAYCYARPTHEYLGMSAGLDFETKIFVKESAPQLLRQELMSPRWKPECINISGVTDCYQPAERHFQLTRKCLQVMAEFRHPVSLITKNQLVTRDLDILKDLAQDNLVIVYLSVTTLDAELARQLEPRTSSPFGRLKAIETLAQAGIPVGVNIAPVIPGLTDHELPNILKEARSAGAQYAGYTPIRLPYSVSELFSEWLSQHRPNAKTKILNQICSMRDGKLNDGHFTSRMRGSGAIADNIEKMFKLFSDRLGFLEKHFKLNCEMFRRPGDQLTLFLGESNY